MLLNPRPTSSAGRTLQARHVTHFLCYMDLGGLTYEQMAPAMRLFAEQVIPHFT